MRVKDKATLYVLYQVVDESNFEKIANAKSSKEMWDILEKGYKKDNHVKQVRLETHIGEFESMGMKETKDVVEYTSHLVLRSW